MSDNPHESDHLANETPPALTFKITPVALLGVLAVATCATPIAFSATWLLPIYLLPLLLAWWIFRTRTVIDTEHLVAQRMFHRTRFSWEDIKSFRLDERRWLRAVLASGKEVSLPAVRVRDIPRLSAFSGGRLPDPTAITARDTAEQDTEARDADEQDVPAPDTETGEPTTAEAEQEATGRDTTAHDSTEHEDTEHEDTDEGATAKRDAAER